MIPKTKPNTPRTAINGDGNGSRTDIAKADNFKAINTIKRKVNIDDHFPVFVIDQT